MLHQGARRLALKSMKTAEFEDNIDMSGEAPFVAADLLARALAGPCAPVLGLRVNP